MNTPEYDGPDWKTDEDAFAYDLVAAERLVDDTTPEARQKFAEIAAGLIDHVAQTSPFRKIPCDSLIFEAEYGRTKPPSTWDRILITNATHPGLFPDDYPEDHEGETDPAKRTDNMSGRIYIASETFPQLFAANHLEDYSDIFIAWRATRHGIDRYVGVTRKYVEGEAGEEVLKYWHTDILEAPLSTESEKDLVVTEIGSDNKAKPGRKRVQPTAADRAVLLDALAAADAVSMYAV